MAPRFQNANPSKAKILSRPDHMNFSKTLCLENPGVALEDCDGITFLFSKYEWANGRYVEINLVSSVILCSMTVFKPSMRVILELTRINQALNVFPFLLCVKLKFLCNLEARWQDRNSIVDLTRCHSQRLFPTAPFHLTRKTPGDSCVHR